MQLNMQWITVARPVLELIVRAAHFINRKTAQEPFNLTTYLSPDKAVAVPGAWNLPCGPASVHLSPDLLLLWKFDIMTLDSLGDFLTDPSRAGTCFIEHDIYYSQLTELWMQAHEQLSRKGNLYVHIFFTIYVSPYLIGILPSVEKWLYNFSEFEWSVALSSCPPTDRLFHRLQYFQPHVPNASFRQKEMPFRTVVAWLEVSCVIKCHVKL